MRASEAGRRICLPHICQLESVGLSILPDGFGYLVQNSILFHDVQVDLTASSIRPALSSAEMTILQTRLIQQVSESTADITVHVSSWEHDTDQGALLPQDRVNMQIYSFADHRLAFYLDEINQLELLLKDCILVQQGFKAAAVALAT